MTANATPSERKPPGVRYSDSHNLDPTAPDLEHLSARFREPGEHEACHHFRSKAAGEHDSFGSATTLTCVGQHVKRPAPFGAKWNLVHRHRGKYRSAT